jgi:hypothetical protein
MGNRALGDLTMADNDEFPIDVVIEGEEESDSRRSARRSSDSGRRASADDGAAARARLASARLQRQGDLNRVEHELLTLSTESVAAEKAFESAADMGDVRAQAAANRRMSAAESRRVLLEQRQEDLKQAPVSSGDPFEDHLSQFTPRTAEWMREHRDWVTDQRKNSKLVGAHHMAIADGLEPDSQSYFEHVERTIGLRGGNGSNNGRTSSSRGSPLVASVRGDTGAGSYRGGSNVGETVTLSKGERDRATDGSIVWNAGNVDANGQVIRHGDPRIGKAIGIQEYARRKLQLDKDGYYNRLG